MTDSVNCVAFFDPVSLDTYAALRGSSLVLAAGFFDAAAGGGLGFAAWDSTLALAGVTAGAGATAGDGVRDQRLERCDSGP